MPCIRNEDKFMNTLNVLPNRPLKAPVDPSTLKYRDLLEGDFWRRIPAYKDIERETFLDHRWQAKKTINRVDKLLAAIEDFASPGLIADMQAGFKRAPMSVRISPYLLSLISGTIQ